MDASTEMIRMLQQQLDDAQKQNAQYQHALQTDPVTGKRMYNADGSPVRPDQITSVDQNGNLKDNFKVNFQQIDPSSLEGYNMLKTLAQTPGQTANAQAQNQLALLQKGRAMDEANKGAMGANRAAINGLAMRGGASSGAKAMLARSGQKDLLGARQGVSQDYTKNLLTIDSQDQDRKLNLLNQFSGMENNIADKNNNIANKGLEFNSNLQTGGVQDANKFTMDAYNSENARWAAEKQASATRAAGGGGGGGCCFIFLEARYGDGTMDAVVRKYRDEMLTAENQRGYYKLSEVLVPLMRKYPLVKLLVRAFMTDPLVAYGKAHYGVGSKLGFVFAPLKNFWLKTFKYLGQDHAFVRENGEVI